jgi:subtilisin family serine protease
MNKLPAAGAVLAIAALAAAAPAAQGRRVLVAVERDGHSPAGGVLSGTLPDGSPTYLVKTPRGTTARAFAHKLEQRRGVIAAQVDRPFWLHPAAQAPAGCIDKPSDPVVGVPSQTNALQVDPGGPTKPIAILDTGIDPNTPELAGRVLPNHDVVGGFTVPDQDGHGTEVASIAAGALGSVRGESPRSPVFSVRIFNSSGASSAAIVVQGITAAVQNGAGVINISAAGAVADGSAQDNQVLITAIEQAVNAGVIVVAPSGNEGKLQADAPGAYPHVLTAGSGNAGQGRDLFSNSGPWVDLMSPANGIIAPTTTNICSSGYAFVTGTSFASPAVAGAVAMLQTLRPELKPQQLLDLIRHAGTDLGVPGWDQDTGFGMLDVATAVTDPAPKLLGNEIDDDVMFAKLKPVIALKLGRTKTIQDTESAAKDNTDVFRIKLKKGEGITANIANKNSNALFSVSLLDRTAGPLDMTNDVTKHILKDSGGLSPTPYMGKRVKKTGTYYIAVETPDALQDEVDDSTPTDQPYALKLKRLKPLKKHHTSKKKSSTKKTPAKKKS